jgi:predicted adenylyl cyclase CyaB
MPNIEIKAKCRDLQKARSIAEKVKTNYAGSLHQVDTYFSTKEGRLKLREINGKDAQLIPYYKEYRIGPMKSSYSVMPVKDPKNLKEILHKILGTITVVDKKREVFLVNNVRIHLDEVKELGSFIEFEAVYKDNTQVEKEIESKKVSELMIVFGIKDEDLLDKSYIDYLLEDHKDN